MLSALVFIWDKLVPGPAQTDLKALKLRGSLLAKGRQSSPPVRPSIDRCAKTPRIGNLRKIILQIPGYDPYTQAGDSVFDNTAARKAVKFFHDELSHVKGEKARTPFVLERWQQAIIANLFGWKRPDGTRRYRQAFVFVPRKNGKSVLAAGIICYCLFEDGEPGAEIYGAASSHSQATLIYDHVRGMINQNDALYDRCKLYTGQAKSVQLHSDYSTYRVVASESGTLHGASPSAYIVDELHALPDGEMIDVLETGTGARRQPLGVLISTSDFEREGSPCNERHDYACKVRDGVIDDSAFLPVIFEATRDDDWTSPKVWAKANPNLGVSVGLDYISAACEKAKEVPSYENVFKRLHLNIRTEQATRWIPLEQWDSCAGEPLRLEDFHGRSCCGGLDLATTRDMTALALVFPEVDGVFPIVPVFWIREETARERSKRDRVPYLTWIKQGWIQTTPGGGTDYGAVRQGINAIIDTHKLDVKELTLDRMFQGEQLGQELAEQDGINVTAFGQGFLSMAGPTKRFAEMIGDGMIRHGGNPVLRWHASNVCVEQDAAGNLKPSRRKSTEKIDGIVAAIMGVARATLHNHEDLWDGKVEVFS